MSASDDSPSIDLQSWVGRERVQEDELSVSQAQDLAATLDRDPGVFRKGSVLPAGWHWIYFHPRALRSEMGPEGHERRGSFLPPIDLPRRMWAGGRIRFPGVLRLGEAVTKRSTIETISRKEGRTGPLVFVTVRHRISNAAGVAVDEEQDLVFRGEGPRGGGSVPPKAAPGAPDWVEAYSADAITLFRFSALTFNAHRIHYDHPYVTEVEGYPGVVVHGPLIALLLLDAGLRNWGGVADVYRYRAVSPLFCDETFHLNGRRAAGELWAAHPERGVAMEAGLELRS